MKKASNVALLFVLVLMICCRSNSKYFPDHPILADTIVERATNLMSGPDPARSLGFLDSAYQSLGAAGRGDLWKKYNAKANYYTYYNHDLKKRRFYIDSMFTVLDKVENQYKYEHAHSLFSLAGLLQVEKKYNQAFRVYYQGRNVAAASNDKCTMSEFSNALGIIRYRQEQYLKAIPFLKQAMQEITGCSNRIFLHQFIQPQSILNTIALCFEKSGQLDSAAHYYGKALAFIKNNEKSYPDRHDFIITARAVVEGNLGGTYAKMGDFKKAQAHLLTNIALNDRPGFSIEDSQTAKLKLVRLYIDKDSTAMAGKILNDLETDLLSGRGKSSAHADIWEKWYELKWLYYDKIGEVPSAYTFSSKYYNYRDSLDQLYNGLKNVDVDQVLREQDQIYRLSLLEKSGELKNLYMSGLSVFLIMSLFIVVIIWLYYRRLKVNVTKLTALNQQMQQTLSALENSQLENTRMMKVVAHDLRNPVGAMVSFADLMLMDPGRPDEDKQFLNLIKDSGNNSLELISNLLHFNVSAKVGLRKEEINLADLIRQCADMLRVRASEKQQEIRLSLQPVTVKLNYEKMWRVMNNLISNAIKFSPCQTVIDIHLQAGDQCVKIFVKDEGIGIPKDLGGKIFDVFTGSQRKGTNGEESFGLGLSITRQIVQAHGGEITFESKTGKGTTFVILLPNQQPE